MAWWSPSSLLDLHAHTGFDSDSLLTRLINTLPRRQFYSCGRWTITERGRQCDFFAWADAVRLAPGAAGVLAAGGGGGKGGGPGAKGGGSAGAGSKRRPAAWVTDGQ